MIKKKVIIISCIILSVSSFILVALYLCSLQSNLLQQENQEVVEEKNNQLEKEIDEDLNEEKASLEKSTDYDNNKDENSSSLKSDEYNERIKESSSSISEVPKDEPILTPPANDSEDSVQEEIIPSQKEEIIPPSKEESSKCESKKFLWSWFRADFSDMESCQAMGNKYMSKYGYSCDYMQDDCGVFYYMLSLFDEGGEYDYHNIQIP